jgi:DNA topoisomerase I
VPLGQRAAAAAPAPAKPAAAAAATPAPAAAAPKPNPPASAAKKPAAAATPKRKRAATTSSEEDDSSDDDSDFSSDSDSDSDDDKPLAARKRSPPASAAAAAKKKKPAVTAPPPAKKNKPADAASTPKAKRARAASAGGGSGGKGGGRRSPSRGAGEKKWTTLSHHGVLFPPEYEPHGVRMLYDGKPVDLTPEQEEIATMFAAMRDTEYMQKQTFLDNFWEGFREVLGGKKHVIQSLSKCDFTPIYEHIAADRERKKQMTREDKAAQKAERDAKEEKYKHAVVDGRREAVGNFRVEPPGLFRGRGEHPRMGKIKKRVYPRDITINIGRGEPVPEHPYPGQKWKEVRHDPTVTWLAFWKDTISPKDFKYVWLGAASSFKADSDLAKYEKARKLKDYIGTIRRNYTRDWQSKDLQRRQMAVAVYFLDKLALRAGHEKDEDEADTVGCCTLKVENVEMVPPSSIKFDFLGKDSIRYENTVEVEPLVYKNVEQFARVDRRGKRKEARDMLFDTFDATDLNKELKSLMDGLSVKVFRTYNASITLDRLLRETEAARAAEVAAAAAGGANGKGGGGGGGAANGGGGGLSVASKAPALTAAADAARVDALKAEYDRANKEVAVLCNHQRSVPKTHGAQMEKMEGKLKGLREELEQAEEELTCAKKGKDRTKDGRKVPGTVEQAKAKVERKRTQLERAELAARVKEDLKTVALGTSKINYCDPRISIAWCKRNDVPIEKVFNRSLITKFSWAMENEPAFAF